jgi:amino acid transporter
MDSIKTDSLKTGFGTAPVYFTAISTILGAILFLRFGMAVGTVGFWGVALIILMGHLVTIPTALAISEIATNTRVEGGGEYFIISRSFGLKIGSTIGMTLYLSQAISVAFYTVAFAEAFSPLFDWFAARYGFSLPRQIISVPTLLLLGWLILRKGSGSGMKMLYVVCGILLLSLVLFFAGSAVDNTEATAEGTNVVASSTSSNFGFFNTNQLFICFAICFPAFTGMTAGVGLSGDLKNPGRSIPLGTMLATLTGLLVYMFVIWKLAASATQDELLGDQLIMGKIAVLGNIVIPIGLAASTISSALGSSLVAPRTLQALAADHSFPSQRINKLLASGNGENHEPYIATMITFGIALVFVLMGSIDSVAQVISMFFLITYGTLCLISFINHFGSAPSYRPRFRSKWYFSLGGFLMAVWCMFMISPVYTLVSYALLAILYIIVEHYNKEERGLVEIFEGALFQLNRRLRVFMQKNESAVVKAEWRPSAICISPHSFERDKVLYLLKWISHQHGFGTYFHFIEGYYGRQTQEEAQGVLRQLIDMQRDYNSALYIDTMISPSYTSALAQVLQAPSISGMENNMVVFEYDKSQPEELSRIFDNFRLAKAGDFDVCIFASSSYPLRTRFGLHIWIRDTDELNTNLMILLGYIILAHPDWSHSQMKLFIASASSGETAKEDIQKRITDGRLPITMANVEIISINEETTFAQAVLHNSARAGLTIVGFREESVGHGIEDFFTSFHNHGMGDMLFVNASHSVEI